MSLFVFLYKRKVGVVNLFPIALWVLGALFSIFYYNSELYYGNKNLSFFPFVYLFILLLVFYKGVEMKDIKYMQKCDSPLIKPLIITIALSAYLPFVELLANILGGGVDFLNIAEIKDDYYSGEINPREILSSLGSKCYSVSMYSQFIAPVFFFYYIGNAIEKKWWIITGLIFAIVNPVLFNLSVGGRGVLVWTFLFFVLLFLVLRNTLKNKDRILIRNVLYIVLAIVLAAFVVITLFRFTSDKYSGFNVSDWIFRYFGESFCNFNEECWNLKHTTNGRNCFAFFSYIVGGDGQRDYLKLESLTGTRMNVYNTMFGDLLYDFGHYLTPIIVLLIYCLAKCFKPNMVVLVPSFLIFSILLYMLLASLFIWPLINRPYPFVTTLVVSTLLSITSNIKKTNK